VTNIDVQLMLLTYIARFRETRHYRPSHIEMAAH